MRELAGTADCYESDLDNGWGNKPRLILRNDGILHLRRERWGGGLSAYLLLSTVILCHTMRHDLQITDLHITNHILFKNIMLTFISFIQETFLLPSLLFSQQI